MLLFVLAVAGHRAPCGLRFPSPAVLPSSPKRCASDIRHPAVSRRQLLLAAGASGISCFPFGAEAAPLPVSENPDSSRYKSYSTVQNAWDKSQTMSQREIMLAARGALKPSEAGEESPRSRKRRAMAGCHDEEFRNQAGFSAEKDCNARVLGGDVQFIIDVMDAELAK